MEGNQKRYEQIAEAKYFGKRAIIDQLIKTIIARFYIAGIEEVMMNILLALSSMTKKM